MRIDPNIKEDLKKYLQDRVKRTNEKVTVISSYALNDGEKKTIALKFLVLQNNRNVQYVVDPSIIAGVQLKVGSKTYDLSLKGQLSNLKHVLYESA